MHKTHIMDSTNNYRKGTNNMAFGVVRSRRMITNYWAPRA